MKQRKTLTRFIMVLFMAGVLLGSGFQIARALRDPETPVVAPTETPMVPSNFSELAERARPGVVNIRTVKTLKGSGPVFRHFYGNPFGEKNPFRGTSLGPFPGVSPRVISNSRV